MSKYDPFDRFNPNYGKPFPGIFETIEPFQDELDLRVMRETYDVQRNFENPERRFGPPGAKYDVVEPEPFRKDFDLRDLNRTLDAQENYGNPGRRFGPPGPNFAPDQPMMEDRFGGRPTGAGPISRPEVDFRELRYMDNMRKKMY